MTAIHNEDLKKRRDIYLSTSLKLIELFNNEIIEIHHLPDFKVYEVENKADVHGVIIIKENIVFNTVYDLLLNKYKNVELIINDSKKMVIHFLEGSFTVELLFIEHSDFHEINSNVHQNDR